MLRIKRRFIFFALLLALAHSAAAQDSGISNQLSYSYADSSGHILMNGMSARSQIVDPRGVVSGCDGALLPSYQGFQIGLYTPDPADPTGTEIKSVLPLTPTAVPAGAGLPLGIAPNAANQNPFPLSDTDKGRFSFLLDPARGQLDAGQVYILALTPPPGSAYRPRRIRITIGATSQGQVSCTAASLDGAPVSGMNGQMTAVHTLFVSDASSGGLALTALNLGLTDCPLREVQIVKTADRATAQPGDTVVYRVSVTNTASLPLANIQILDTPPLGFSLRPDSVRAAVGSARVPVTLGKNGPATVFDFGPLTLPAGGSLTLAYALLLSPDALRGDGKNSAVVTASAQMTMNGTTMTSPISDGPAVFTLGVRQGILTDTGTILGRVWIDRSRDGEQQDGEPGLPGAVLLLDDSTRIVADADGLFSLAAVPAGYHSAVLDLQSVPGYTLARGRFKERRSQSRMVHITPGGLVRLNFAVVPAAAPAAVQLGRGAGSPPAPILGSSPPAPILGSSPPAPILGSHMDKEVDMDKAGRTQRFAPAGSVPAPQNWGGGATPQNWGGGASPPPSVAQQGGGR